LAIDVLPLETGTDVTYAQVRTALEKTGTPIGANDLLIAAQALSLRLTLVTHNTDEFARVGRLQLENWLTV
jgi:tRNA(fMet)-specific endonuclease VapC